ncbi:RNA polymerase sigma factor [Streptomyces sp. L7]
MVPLNHPTDEELTRRAQAGDTGALGLLLTRHQAPMRAVALSLLGYGPDAEDAVQDAALTALRRIGDVREPAAAGRGCARSYGTPRGCGCGPTGSCPGSTGWSSCGRVTRSTPSG